MSNSLFALAVIVGAYILALIASPRRVFEYPFSVGLIYLIWVVPQARTIEKISGMQVFEPHMTWIYTIICLFALTIGFYAARRKLPVTPDVNQAQIRHRIESETMYHGDRLLLMSLGMIIVGFLFNRLALSTAEAQGLSTEWTGVATLYYLIQSIHYYGLCLAVLLWFRDRSKAALVVVVIGTLAALPFILEGVKRNVIFEIGFIFAGALFFARRIVPSRVILIAACAFGALLLHQIGSVRGYVKAGYGNAYEAVRDGALLQDFDIENVSLATEMNHAVQDIYATRTLFKFDYGAPYWNKLIHSYVPGFIVGVDTKREMKIETEAMRLRRDIVRRKFNGATRTGFSDTFRNFWYFGALVFLIIGIMFGTIFNHALLGSLKAQFFYLILLNDGLIAITEGTQRFVSGFPFLLIIMFGVFLICRRSSVSASVHERHLAL